MMNGTGKLVCPAIAALFALGCATNEPEPTPAVLATADNETMAVVTATLAAAMDRANIELGAGDPATEPVIVVLPPPPGPDEDRSLAKPTYFDLVLIGDGCFAVKRDTGAEYALEGISCRQL